MQIAWADIAVFSMLENFKGFKVDVEDFVKTDVSDLQKIADRVANEPRIAEWIKKRPVTNM